MDITEDRNSDQVFTLAPSQPMKRILVGQKPEGRVEVSVGDYTYTVAIDDTTLACIVYREGFGRVEFAVISATSEQDKPLREQWKLIR
ncbi:hypothetical protein [Sphaerisporangium sp. NPDC051011]|uniref:hypothetical protein n=1 Tax=Sphaerisporangium sp. NPDC051011 TaxID=3155792 RepID=UPI0033F5D8AC